jgi:hypothetical protein
LQGSAEDVGSTACLPVDAGCRLPGCGSRVATDPGGEGLGFVHALLDTSVSSDETVGYVSALATIGEAAGRALMAAAEDWACG